MVVLLAAAAALSACAGNGNGLDSNGNPIAPGGGGSTPLTADFKSIQDNIFTPICTKCHIGAGAPHGLQLDAAHSYNLLFNVPSDEQPNVLRVAPGQPDNSYIIRKLQNTPGISGQQMPLGGPYLPQSTIDVIRQWITNGAQNNTTSATGMSVESSIKAVQHFGITMTSPDDGSIVSMDVSQIVVGFNGGVDSNLLNDTTVTVSAAGTGAAPEIPVLISTRVPAGNPSALLITPQTPLGNGSYRVTLHRTLANMNAQALGSDYSFAFTVDVLK